MGRQRTKGRQEGDGKGGEDDEVKQREMKIDKKAVMERKMETERMGIEKEMDIKGEEDRRRSRRGKQRERYRWGKIEMKMESKKMEGRCEGG